MDQKIIVALDAMGGDLAPVETVKGAVDAVKEMNVLVKLVGREDDVNRELAKYTYPKEKIEVVMRKKSSVPMKCLLWQFAKRKIPLWS